MDKQLSILLGIISILTISGLYLAQQDNGALSTPFSNQQQEQQYEMNQISASYEQWAKKYSKEIDYVYKFQNFVESYKQIMNHNKSNSSYKLGLNKFADLNDFEFEATYLMAPSKVAVKEQKQQLSASATLQKNKVDHISGSVDFRKKGVVNDVQNQGSCGSCYTFAAAQATESAYALQTNLGLMKFSEQQLVSCSSVFYGNNGCSGGFGNTTFSYIIESGIDLLENYPYVSGANGEVPECKVEQGEYKISSYTEVFGDGHCLNIQEAAKNQPLYARAFATDWKLYESGIYNGCTTEDPNDINHGIGIIGYETTSSNSEDRYWLIRNSWGPDWGEEGYMKLQFGNSCAICYQSFFPTV